ncbi:serine/threonine-protein kinase [Candidatus Thiothrix sp. Deng01]|uniref:Serine/threonine-protein kinase n=1 Tax=Candidatus Thiothrix phosphatis TaxID=3112415 RepID=A0ABU6D2Q6_9GAMM|nr:serine/threonine-protein kinase [Candidatus Thiothrix sp. Deng01]MEB4593300.1 serine/threonine-protein kinase [Candidatus Thiothrix sp. Deng01]
MLQHAVERYPLDLPGYQFLKVLHDSENAIIFLAHNPTGLQVVIKRFKFNAAKLDKKLIDEFLMETWALELLGHRGLVRPLEAGVCSQALYMVMEYVPGNTLRRHLTLTPLPSQEQALRWFEEIALALEAIHSIGLLHQDLKTSNILLRLDGSLALLDFGLETRLLVATGFMRTDEIYCTPYYVSPERIMGDPPDERSDLYSLGIILYELLVGHKPYESKSLTELLKKHAVAKIPMLPDKLRDYQSLIIGLLAKFPENRIQSASEVVRLLHKIQSQQKA